MKTTMGNNGKLPYISPEIEIIEFEAEDVIVSSLLDTKGKDGGNEGQIMLTPNGWVVNGTEG